MSEGGFERPTPTTGYLKRRLPVPEFHPRLPTQATSGDDHGLAPKSGQVILEYGKKTPEFIDVSLVTMRDLREILEKRLERGEPNFPFLRRDFVK